jgi:hypothetical protein
MVHVGQSFVHPFWVTGLNSMSPVECAVVVVNDKTVTFRAKDNTDKRAMTCRLTEFEKLMRRS